MSGHGVYVWSVYVLFMLMVLWQFLAPLLAFKKQESILKVYLKRR